MVELQGISVVGEIIYITSLDFCWLPAKWANQQWVMDFEDLL